MQKSASQSSDIGVQNQSQKMRITSLADKRLEMKNLKNATNTKDQNMHLSGKREIIEGNATPRLMEKGERDVQ
jgi:hypothetical protein